MECYFKEQAERLLQDLSTGAISIDDVARGLECTYAAGVLDAPLYTKEQKNSMYNNIKNMYKLPCSS
jgi:hypothetical protein